MTLSKRILLLLTFLSVTVTTAKTVTESFETHKNDILECSIATYEGVVFLHGKAALLKRGEEQIGYVKAKANAFQQLEQQVYNQVPWPNDIKDDEKAATWLYYRQEHPLHAEAVGAEIVYQYYDRTTHLHGVILGIPETQVNIDLTIDPQKIEAALKTFRKKREALIAQERLRQEQLEKARLAQASAEAAAELEDIPIVADSPCVNEEKDSPQALSPKEENPNSQPPVDEASSPTPVDDWKENERKKGEKVLKKVKADPSVKVIEADIIF